MALFGKTDPDPKDEIISVLREERDYLRRKLESMEAQFLALTSTHAFRLVHPEEGEKGVIPAPPPDDAFLKRTSDHRPSFTLRDLEDKLSPPIDPFRH